MNATLRIIAIAVTAALLIPFLVGCQPIQPGAVHTAAGTATGQLQAVDADLKAIKVHTQDQYIAARADSADEGVIAVLKQMPVFEQAADALAKAQAQVSEWNNWWLGPRFWRWFYTILGVMGALAIAQIVLYVVAGTSPVGIWKTAAAIIGHVIGFVNVGVGYIITLIRSHTVTKAKVAVAAATGDPAPAPGTITIEPPK